MGRTRSGGNTYELKARFSIESDTKGVETMLRRLNTLEKKMKSIDGRKANLNVNSRGVDVVQQKLDNVDSKMDDLDGKEAEAKVKEKGVEETERKIERLEKYLDAFTKAEHEVKLEGDATDVMKTAAVAQKRYEKLTAEAFELRIEAAMIGDKGVMARVQRLQEESTKLGREKAFVTTGLRGDVETSKKLEQLNADAAEFGRLRAEAEMTADNAQAVRAFREAETLGKRIAGQAYTLTLRGNSVHARQEAEDIRQRLLRLAATTTEVRIGLQGATQARAQLSAMTREVQHLASLRADIDVNADTTQALAQVKAVDTSVRTLTARAFKIMMTADSSDVRQEASVVYGILSNLSRQTAEVKMKLQGRAEVEQGIDSVERNLQELTTRPWEAEVQGDVSQAQRAFSALAAQARAQFSRAYKLQIQAETQGFTEAAAQADNLKRQMLSLAQSRAAIAVELQGVPAAISGLVSVKRAASDVEGTYRIGIDYSKVGGAVSALFSLRGAATAVGGVLGALGSHMANSANAAGTLSRAAFVSTQILQVFAIALGAIALAAAGPMVAGLGIATGAILAFAGGFGLVLAAIAPVISALGNLTENQKKADTAQKAATTSANQLTNAEQQLAQAHGQVAKAAQQGEQQIASAVKAHEDAVRGVDQARKQYGQALQGVQDAEVRGEEQIQSAIRAHAQSVQGVQDAQRGLERAVRDVADAEVAAQEGIQQALKAHRDALRGLDDAYRAYDKAAQAVADAQVDAQEQVVDALKAQEDAVVAVAEAEIQAQRDIKSARNDLASALRSLEGAQYSYEQAIQSSADAQKELTYATEDYNDALATEQQRLLSLQYDLEGLGINQRQLALDISEASRQITEAETSEDRQRAALRYEELLLRQKEGVLAIEQAQARLGEAQTEGTQELQSAYDAQQNAIDGVTDATRNEQEAYWGVEDAITNVGEAAGGVTEAQVQGARNIQDAQEALLEANNDVTKAQTDGARSVQEAQEGLADAARGIQDAQERVGETAAGVSKAQIDGARQVADAQEGVADAQRALTKAIEEEQIAQANIGKARDEAARGVADAMDRVADAQLGIEDAMRREEDARIAIDQARQQAADQMQAALDNVAQAERALAQATEENQDAISKLGEALAEIPSDALAIAAAAKALWENFKNHEAVVEARQAVSDLAVEVLNAANGAVPYLAQATLDTTNAMIQAYRDVGTAWGDHGVFNSLITILEYIPSVTGNMSTAFGYAFGGLINVFGEMMPFVERFSQKVEELALRFLTWSDSAAGREQIRDFFAAAAPVAEVLGYWIWQIGGGLITWATSNPQAVADIINFIGSIIWGVGYGIGFVVTTLSDMNAAVPGLGMVAGALAGIYFAVRLIPTPIRAIVYALGQLLVGKTIGPQVAAGLDAIKPSAWGAAGSVATTADGFTDLGDKSRRNSTIAVDAMGNIKPAAAGAASGVDEAGAAANRSGGFFSRMGGYIKGAGGAMLGLIPGIGILAGIGPVGWAVVAAIAAVAAAAYLIYQNWDWIGPWFWGVWEGIRSVASAAWSYISADIYAAGTAIWTFLTTQWGMIQTWWGQMMAGLSASTSISWSEIGSWISWGVNGIVSIIQWAAPMIGYWFQWAWDNVVTIVSAVWTVLSGIVSGGLQVLGGIIMFWSGVFTGDWNMMWQGMGWIASGAWTAIVGIVSGMWTAISGLFYNALLFLENTTGIRFTAIYYWIADALTWAWGTVSYYVSAIANAVYAAWSQADSWTQFFFYAIWGTIDAVTGGWLTSTFGNVQAIWQYLSDTWNNAHSITDFIFNLMWDAIDTATGGWLTTISTVLSDIWGWVEWAWNGIWNYLFGGSIMPDIENAFILSWGTTIFNGITQPLSDIWSYVIWAWDGIWNYLFGASMMPDLENAFATSWGTTIYGSVTQALYDMWGYVEWAWNGIWDYLFGSSMMPDIESYMDTSWSNIYDTISSYSWDAWGTVEDNFNGMYDYLFGNSIMPDMEADFEVSWNTIWQGASDFGGWIYDTLNSAFGDTIKTALDWLSQLLYGAQWVLDAIGDPGGWSATIGDVAARLDYYEHGGIKYAADGASTQYMDRGGIGTNDPQPQHVIWNEQHGNEAWIAERGPREANLGYLRHAAGWLDMEVVPRAAGGVAGEPIDVTHKHEERRGVQTLPPPFYSLAGGAGTEDKRKMMANGGVLYAAHGATLPWDTGLTSRTAEIANEIYSETNAGNLYYNTYYGHPDGFPEREQYSVDWWNGYRGGQISTGEGDAVVAKAQTYPEFSYYIWNGSDSYDGSIATYDPHYDHAHTTFMGDIGLSGGGSGGGSYWRTLAQKFIDMYMPEVPDFGDTMPADAVEGVAEHIRSGAIEFIMSLLPKGGGSGAGSTEEVNEWIRAGLEFGNAFSPTEENIATMAGRAMQESSGDPNAINDYDINAQNGTPSKGLFQIIEPTWESHRAMYGTDAGAFSDNWNDPVMSAAVASRYMKNVYGYIVGSNGVGYTNGGIATGPQLGMLGDNGPEAMIPLDHPNAVGLLQKAFNTTDPLRNRVTGTALESQNLTTDNLLTAGADNAIGNVGITSDAALIGEKIDNMKDEIKQSLREEFAETELGGDTMEKMVKAAVATALAVVDSRAARDIIDENLGEKFEFDREMSEL